MGTGRGGVGTGGKAVFSLVFRVTGKSVFLTGKAALLKIFFYPGAELPS